MVEEWSTVSDEKNLKAIFITIIVFIGIITTIGLTLSADWTEQTHNEPGYTTFFTTVTPQDAYELVYNNSHPLTIIDARSCDCAYNKGHISGAIWEINPTPFYNSTIDLLIYCEDGIESSLDFCEKLVGHTYVSIYHLEGGIDAWKNAGYRTTKL